MDYTKTTESDSHYNRLESMSVEELLTSINKEDQTVPQTIEKIIPNISNLIDAIVPRMKQGGRLFYMGAGTSGRLGIVDASECPPTYGIPHGIVVGLIAGGDNAIRKAVEFAEDSTTQGWEDLLNENICDLDTVIGIAASGSTPYVVHALKECQKRNILTGCITCNEGSPITTYSDFPIVAVVGPEFVTGSTRMKAGTAQKLILNMISTSVMIQLGRVKGNKMVDMQLSNNKLIDRGTRMIMNELAIDEITAADLLNKYGSVRAAIEAYNSH
ncbi:MAG: N-acetylmuramic acid 6-phosphate etherase [Bacteroidota bacterium]